MEQVPEELKESQALFMLPDEGGYTKTLGVEWNIVMDHFCLKITKLPPVANITKHFLVSDVTWTFDVLGWFSP